MFRKKKGNHEDEEAAFDLVSKKKIKKLLKKHDHKKKGHLTQTEAFAFLDDIHIVKNRFYEDLFSLVDDNGDGKWQNEEIFAHISDICSYHPVFSIGFVGDCVHGGKTSLINYIYSGQGAGEAYNSTTSDMKRHDVDGFPLEIELWDTSGNQDYTNVRTGVYNYFDIVVVAFSIANENSYTNVMDTWKLELKNHIPYVPRFLVASHNDLDAQVSDDQLNELKHDIHAEAAFTVSCKTGDGIEDFFESCLNYAREHFIRA
eukprot:TRINITY_DN3358_c0_g1_i1.p1 TRINITY_DN3358_c0_g1~~TRINITY_DN3358_c0_g1_i1.p1  ORF type:complete len:259 (+),score=64.41 TRINITY_DN3358_c0_g1_i1:66-842(+)